MFARVIAEVSEDAAGASTGAVTSESAAQDAERHATANQAPGWHVDGMLPALAGKDDERPRLVHRLDRDTSGVLVLGRTARATRALNDAFRLREMQKLYWAICIGILNLLLPIPHIFQQSHSVTPKSSGENS